MRRSRSQREECAWGELSSGRVRTAPPSCRPPLPMGQGPAPACGPGGRWPCADGNHRWPVWLLPSLQTTGVFLPPGRGAFGTASRPGTPASPGLGIPETLIPGQPSLEPPSWADSRWDSSQQKSLRLSSVLIYNQRGCREGTCQLVTPGLQRCWFWAPSSGCSCPLSVLCVQSLPSPAWAPGRRAALLLTELVGLCLAEGRAAETPLRQPRGPLVRGLHLLPLFGPSC